MQNIYKCCEQHRGEKKKQEVSLGTLVSYVSVCRESSVYLNDHGLTPEAFLLKNNLISRATTLCNKHFYQLGHCASPLVENCSPVSHEAKMNSLFFFFGLIVHSSARPPDLSSGFKPHRNTAYLMLANMAATFKVPGSGQPERRGRL